MGRKGPWWGEISRYKMWIMWITPFIRGKWPGKRTGEGEKSPETVDNFVDNVDNFPPFLKLW